MRKWEKELAKKKQSIEKELLHCFKEMVRICEEMRKSYEEISDDKLQKYLNLEGNVYIQIEDEIEEKYPYFGADLVRYVQWKDRFYECCSELEALGW